MIANVRLFRCSFIGSGTGLSAGRVQCGGEYDGVFAPSLRLIVGRTNSDLLETHGTIEAERDLVRRPHLEEDFVACRVAGLEQQRVQEPTAVPQMLRVRMYAQV